MKTLFPGFYSLTEEEENKQWLNSIFVLDTSFILDIFRLDDNNAGELLTILENRQIQSKLWIPYDIAWLYHQYVNSEILSQIENIKTFLSNLTSCNGFINEKKCYPYFSEHITFELKKLSQIFKNEANKQIEKLGQSLKISSRKERINNLFSKKIGEPYEEAILNEIYIQANDRYLQQIPPGYCAESHPTKRIMYHDMIVWKQIQKHAQIEKTDIIMITGQTREDWFYVINNDIISPRQEIINEFRKETNQSFYCLKSTDFIKECNIRFKIGNERTAKNLIESLSMNNNFTSSFNHNTVFNKSSNNSI